MRAAPSPGPPIRLRPVLEQDRAFLYEVYASSREAELAPVPWTPEQKRSFLVQQFEAQDRHYRAEYAGAEFLVIQVEGRDAGRLYLHRSPGELLLMDIALIPSFQKQGVGTRILSDLAAAADREGRSMTLHVEASNHAMNLYLRLGFRPEEDIGLYIRMSRPRGGVS